MLHWIASLALSEAGRRDEVRVRRGSRAGGGGVCLGEVGGVSDPVGRAVGHGRATIRQEGGWEFESFESDFLTQVMFNFS